MDRPTDIVTNSHLDSTTNYGQTDMTSYRSHTRDKNTIAAAYKNASFVNAEETDPWSEGPTNRIIN